MTIQSTQTTQNEGGAPNESNKAERAQGESLTNFLARAHNVVRRKGRPPALPKEKFDPHSVEGFFSQLRHKLATYGINFDSLPRLSAPKIPPPCFKLGSVSYEDWLKHACDAPPPVRYDMPGEPNYCHDCTAPFKMRAQVAGKCRFPNTRFERISSLGEMETVGVSRSLQEPPADDDVAYNGMKLPAASLSPKVYEYVRANGLRKIGPLEWLRMPASVRAGLSGRESQMRKNGNGT